MKGKSRLFAGLFAVLSIVFAVLIACTQLLFDWAILVDLKLGITSTSSVSSDDIDENSVYYKSSFGDVSALYKSESSRTAEEKANLERIKEELLEAEKQFCIRTQEEGSVLLYNKDDALPLSSSSKVSLFGYASAYPVYRSSSGSTAVNVEGRTISFYNGLKNAGFTINDTLYDAIEAVGDGKRVSSSKNGQSDIGELDVSFYSSYTSTFSEYSDAAIVIFARTGGEGIDLNTTDIDGISQLALHDEEKDVLKMIKDSGAFKKTIVIIDSGYPMELGWVDDEEYGVDACLWIGNPGMYGFEGVGNILAGKANPSGKLTDTYAENSMSSPAMQNFGDISYSNNSEYKYIVEAEGIYVGYKYYETRYEDSILGAGNATSSAGSSTGDSWNYTDEVTYPFGYGLSYTEFTQTLDKVEYDAETDEYTVYVTVENVGKVAGKCAVQIYAQVPYDKEVGECESVRLVGFNKTYGTKSNGEKETDSLTDRDAGTLAPGEKETVEVTIDRYLLTTYSEKAKSGKGGYVLTGGDYYIAVGENAHEALNNILALKGATGMVDENGNPYTPDESRVQKLATITYDDSTYAASPYTGEEVVNQMSRQSIDNWVSGITYLSRSDWKGTYPTKVVLSLTDEMKKEMDGGTYVTPSDAPAKGTYTQGQSNGIDFIDMKDVPYTGTYIDADGKEQSADEMWEKFLDQISTEDLIANTTNGNDAIANINAPGVKHGDGPDGFYITCYNSEVVASATFNPKVLKMRGDLQAEDGIYSKFTVVWGSGCNIHRTPFSGRNFEYYSECGYMGYLCASYQIEASQKKGLITCVKHFVGNNQETNRTGVAVFNCEQAWRESSMKVFEGAIAKGGSLGVMTSFTLIGCTPAPSCSATNIDIMQNEWGFKGICITDSSYQMSYMDSVDCIMNGTTTFCLDNRESDLKKSEGRSSTDDLLQGLRQANKQYYYALLRSNAVNGIVPGATVSGTTSWWKTALIAIDITLGVLTVASLSLYIVSTVKNKKKEEA